MARTLNVRVDDAKVAKLDALAKLFDRDRSYLVNEALDGYLATQEWQIESIRKALAQAERGEFASEEEVEAAFNGLLE